MKGTQMWTQIIMVIAASQLLFFTAASSKSGSGDNQLRNKPSEAVLIETGSGGAESQAVTELLGKYDPPIEITSARIVDATYKYNTGETIENNIWTKAYLDELGIKLKYDWVIGNDQAEQKMNVAFSSGHMPDFTLVNALQLKQLADADMLLDLTDIYDMYASPLTKKLHVEVGTQALEAATIGGKLMAIPESGATIENAQMIWLRTDWLQKLSLPEPKTMDDLFQIAEAFAKQDPDGNGKNDTYGMFLSKELLIDGFFSGYHAYPRFYLKDASGALVYGSIQPEIKPALQKLQDMYKAGLFDKEFGVKPFDKAAEDVKAGKIGFMFSSMSSPIFPLKDSKKNDPKAEWSSYPLVSTDDKPALAQTPAATIYNYYVVKKGTKHPEALLKMINLYAEKGYGEHPNPVYFINNGVETFKYAPFKVWPPEDSLDTQRSIAAALQTGDTSKLRMDQRNIYDMIINYQSNGDVNDWEMERVYSDKGSFGILDQYLNENKQIKSAYFGTPTKTMALKGSTAYAMEIETYTKIIMGAPIDEFDRFVDQRNRLGGSQITQEVNEWYMKQN
ncbi:extracellular solute-binding protein [Paenibacillus eucommiae]|uniref:Aldouronate transport system substrate-binding protein n=1 Tax=Paenibacillus eucommiae TaxID=1355755 RepID=A0ABS4J4E1_9BACL|nr:extracellular solute-binding protein [Paenibacillus eucommiae]MBP1994704.1 putative aldouronate transport system substrate-binding protein [Paenibacillus eucommiae]